jgi:hypothetical protein
MDVTAWTWIVAVGGLLANGSSPTSTAGIPKPPIRKRISPSTKPAHGQTRSSGRPYRSPAVSECFSVTGGDSC